MLKWTWRIAVTLLSLVLLLGLLAWAMLRGSLPPLDGNASLGGLSAPATIQRDRLGVVTIDAASEADALRALGYVHAQERYFEMDLMRRTAAGELAALFGPVALEVDKQHRLHRFRARIRAELDAIAGDRRAPLEAYVAGVNAGLAQLRVRPWPYLPLRQSPVPWRMEDTPLVGIAMAFDLQGGDNPDELALARLQTHLPAPLFALLARDGSHWDAPLLGEPREDATLPPASAVDLHTLPMPAQPAASMPSPRPEPGSNQFAVAGPLTRDGRAIVADDMHLGLRAPNLWFRARLRYPDAAAPGGQVDVQGVTLPGLPGVIVGSNSHVAWGFTNSYIDSQDWAVERLCVRGERPSPATPCSPATHHVERIAVAHGDPVDLAVNTTAWGPALHRLPDGRALTLRWSAHLPGAINLELPRLAKAKSLDTALQMADTIAIPTQNLLLADGAGRIAWRLLGPLPQREGDCDASASLARALSAPAASTSPPCPPWTLSTTQSPRLASPSRTRLWTANNRTLDGDALRKVGDGGYAFGARARQIRDALSAQERFTERDLLAIQLDDRAVFLQRWWKLLVHQAAMARSPALVALSEAAKDWNGHAAPDSVAYRVTRAWRLAVHARLRDGLTAPAQAALGKDFTLPDLPQFESVAWPLVQQRPAHLLPRRFQSWDALFEDAAREVRDDLSGHGPLAQRTWGERNTAAICHPLAQAIPLVGKRLLCMPPDPLPGDVDMPRVQAPAFGASQRMVVSPGHEGDGLFHMPGGQSGHPLSPFWGAGHDDWVHGRPTPFLPGAPVHTLRLQP